MSKKEIKQLIKVILIAILVFWLLNNLSVIKNTINNILNVLFPFLLGAIFAFLFNIPMSNFERFFRNRRKDKKNTKFDRVISIILSIVVIFIIIIFLFKLVIPELINVCELLFDKAPYLATKAQEFIQKALENEGIKNTIENISFDTEKVKETIFSNGQNFLFSSIGIITGIFNGIFNLILGIVFAVYILLSKEKIKKFSKNVLLAYFSRQKAIEIIRILRLSRDTFRKFVVGQCVEACILGILCMIGMLILRIPYAITIGALVGATALIPILGAFIGALVGAILILSVEPMKAFVFLIFFIILQQIEGQLIYPKVVGSSVGLPGLLALLVVIAGGSLGGVVGILVGLPIVSIIYTILKEDVNKRLKKKEIYKENE